MKISKWYYIISFLQIIWLPLLAGLLFLSISNPGFVVILATVYVAFLPTPILISIGVTYNFNKTLAKSIFRIIPYFGIQRASHKFLKKILKNNWKELYNNWNRSVLISGVKVKYDYDGVSLDGYYIPLNLFLYYWIRTLESSMQIHKSKNIKKILEAKLKLNEASAKAGSIGGELSIT